MDITLEHPFFSEQKQIEKICRPLFLHTPFRYFDYQRYYFDGFYLNLTSNRDFSVEILRRELLPNLKELQHNTAHYVYLSPELAIPDLVTRQNKFGENMMLSKEFKIYHRLYVIFYEAHYAEGFCFGLTKQAKNIIDIYMNHVYPIEKFCVYFREAAKGLLKQIEKTKISAEKIIDPMLFNVLDFKTSYSYTEFLKAIKLKNHCIKGKHGDRELSEREFECLLWIAKNKTAKEIAKLLSLSPRTVETYFEILKNKLGCESKFELIETAFKNPIIKSYIE